MDGDGYNKTNHPDKAHYTLYNRLPCKASRQLSICRTRGIVALESGAPRYILI